MSSYSDSWKSAPFYSSKFDLYFEVYEEIFTHLQGKSPTFLEIGIQGGGSLFAWREFFGKDSRIIGVDLNPDCKDFEDFGFEIYIGDAADENFLKTIFEKIGKVDAILDDGGHLFHQQINVLETASRIFDNTFTIAIEDSSTSFYKEFLKKSIKNRTFIQYAKDLSDFLHLGFSYPYPNAIPKFNKNHKILKYYRNLNSIKFYKGITVFEFKQNEKNQANLLTNEKPIRIDSDFRYDGLARKKFLWPDLRKEKYVNVGLSMYTNLINFFKKR